MRMISSSERDWLRKPSKWWQVILWPSLAAATETSRSGPAVPAFLPFIVSLNQSDLPNLDLLRPKSWAIQKICLCTLIYPKLLFVVQDRLSVVSLHLAWILVEGSPVELLLREHPNRSISNERSKTKKGAKKLLDLSINSMKAKDKAAPLHCTVVLLLIRNRNRKYHPAISVLLLP